MKFKTKPAMGVTTNLQESKLKTKKALKATMGFEGRNSKNSQAPTCFSHNFRENVF